MVNTNVTVYLLRRIVNLTPAERSIETDLAATKTSFQHSQDSKPLLPSCTHATRNQLARPSHNPRSRAALPALELGLARVQVTPPQVDI
jgi:hypothetical protein